ncbi:MAG TPA: glycoside hydrolase family 16 protein [Gemmatimonadaceae bacterium]
MTRPPSARAAARRSALAALAAALPVALLFAACVPPAGAPQAASADVPSAAAPAAGEVVFFDDFAGSSLDRTKWTVEVWGHTVNDENQAYIDSPETIAIVHGDSAAGAVGGALELRPRWRPGFPATDSTTLDFVSGRVNTRGKFTFAHGTTAARMKLPYGAGLWPAFWILGTGDWPQTGEIDVMEYVGDSTWTSVALHGDRYFGDTPLVHRQRFPAGTDAGDWHVYSVDWTADAIVFRVDGGEVYRVTRPMVERYGTWAFDDAKYLILNLALGGVYPASVNGAREPYLGLPASTVEAIRRNEVRVLVDWVRVTKR